jgi:hypothetical protein
MKKIQPATEKNKDEKSFAREKKYTVAEIALDLKKTTKTIYKYIRERQLEAYKTKSNDIIITESQYNRFAEKLIELKHWLSFIETEQEVEQVIDSLVKVDIEKLTEEQFLNAYVRKSDFIELFDIKMDETETKTKETTKIENDYLAGVINWIEKD